MSLNKSHILLLFFFVKICVASLVQADGLVHQLPTDGAWVRYKLSEQGTFTVMFPSGLMVPPGLKKAQNLPVESGGSVELRSVGRDDVNGEECRWIELELRAETSGKFPDPATGDLLEKKENRHIILKMLIPQKQLASGADPLAHVRKLYFKDGELESELIEDDKAKQYELDRFRPIFPAPARKVESSGDQIVNSPNQAIGDLTCEMHSFQSKYEGPLARGERGWWSWHGIHQLSLHDKVPFGVAMLKFSVESDEWAGDKEQSPKITVKSTKVMTVTEFGFDAKSELPDLK